MKTHQLSPRSLHRLTLAVLASGFIFSSSAHAIFVSESHACKSNSQTGGAWVGGYYKPNTRTAVTHQVNENASQTLTLQITMWAYPEGSTAFVSKTAKTTTPPGVRNNHVSTSITDANTAPGRVTSMSWAWYPGVTRVKGNGTAMVPTTPFGSNGCRNMLAYF